MDLHLAHSFKHLKIHLEDSNNPLALYLNSYVDNYLDSNSGDEQELYSIFSNANVELAKGIAKGNWILFSWWRDSNFGFRNNVECR